MKSGWAGGRDISGTTVLQDRSCFYQRATKQYPAGAKLTVHWGWWRGAAGTQLLSPAVRAGSHSQPRETLWQGLPSPLA